MANKPAPHIYASAEAAALAVILTVIVKQLTAKQKGEIVSKVAEVATNDQGELGVTIISIGQEILGHEIRYQNVNPDHS